MILTLQKIKMMKFTRVVATLRPVSEVQKLDTKVRTELRRKGHTARYTFRSLVGTSKRIKEAISLSKKFAKTDLTILLEGESGCGKEVLAQGHPQLL